MYVISRTGKVFLQAQEHINTYSLVGLHHLIEHKGGTKEKQCRTSREECYEDVFPERRFIPQIYQISYQHDSGENLHPDDIEAYDILREEQTKNGSTQGAKHHEDRLTLCLAITHYKDRRKDVDNHHDDKRTYVGRGVHNGGGSITDAYDEINHHG